MAKSPQAILNDLRQNKMAPVYFLHGEEPFFIDQIIDFLESNIVPEAERGFNQSILYGKEVSMADVLNHARQFPFGARRKLVIVKEAQDMADLKRGEKGKEMLINYLKNPQPSTILAFAHKTKKIDGKTKIAKALNQFAETAVSEKVRDYKIPEWVEGYFKERDIKITKQAIMVLSENIGADLSRLHNEIQKLLLNVDKTQEIRPETVIKYVGVSKEFNVFELQNELLRKNAAKAYKMADYYDKIKKDGLLRLEGVLGSIYNTFSKVAVAQEKRSAPKQELAKLLRVHPYFLDSYIRAADKYSARKIANIFIYIHKADLQSKKITDPSASESQILKELLYKIFH